MKRFILGLVFWGALVSASYAAQDRFGSARHEIPRSSITASNDSYILITTGACVLRDVIVTSATAGGNIQFWNFTSSALGTAGNERLPILTDTSGNKGPFDMYFSSGIAYRKNGTSVIVIKWDYVYPSERIRRVARPNFEE